MNGDDTSDLPPYRSMPMTAVSHLAGQFLAFGIMVALCKTITVRWRCPLSDGRLI
jgi:hypothetical protein